MGKKYLEKWQARVYIIAKRVYSENNEYYVKCVV